MPSLSDFGLNVLKRIGPTATKGLNLLSKKSVYIPLGLGVGYHLTPKQNRPRPIHDLSDGASYAMSGGPGMVGGYKDFLSNEFINPGLASSIFPNAQWKALPIAFSAMAHEDLSARYGGPNPNSDSALFINNFNNYGQYNGPTAPRAQNSSLGYLSSAMNVNPNGSLLFGLYNNRLS